MCNYIYIIWYINILRITVYRIVATSIQTKVPICPKPKLLLWPIPKLWNTGNMIPTMTTSAEIITRHFWEKNSMNGRPEECSLFIFFHYVSTMDSDSNNLHTNARKSEQVMLGSQRGLRKYQIAGDAEVQGLLVGREEIEALGSNCGSFF